MKIAAISLATLMTLSFGAAHAAPAKALPAHGKLAARGKMAHKHQPRGKNFHKAVHGHFEKILKERIAKVTASYKKLLDKLHAELAALKKQLAAKAPALVPVVTKAVDEAKKTEVAVVQAAAADVKTAATAAADAAVVATATPPAATPAAAPAPATTPAADAPATPPPAPAAAPTPAPAAQ